nr:upf0481 protein [Quercus suber]
MNNKDQNTQKEANISGGIRNKNDELVIEIRKIFERPEIQPSIQCLIYKVPRHLRKWKEEAYTAQVVSIGPFHHKNKGLRAMEEHKERYFRSFAKRSAIKLEYLVGTIREMEESIHGCYAETIDLTSDRFVKMILMDASFILELFFRFSSRSWTSDGPMFVKPRASALPFFVIEKLQHLAFPYLLDYDGLLELSYNYFGHFSMQSIQALPNVKIEHFTDLLRTFQIPPLEKRPKRGNEQNDLLYTAT